MKEETKLENLRHSNKMEEIEAERLARTEIENLKFDQAMQLQRIRSAEIKRSIDRKADKRFAESYSR